jgi:hypothetical protein
MNGEQIVFHNAFDDVFSNAALWWTLRAEAVIVGVWQPIRPGGRLVGEMGSEDNVYHMVVQDNGQQIM